MKKVLVLFSGGVDSTVCLTKAVREIGAENVGALSIYYGQKHKKEIEVAKSIANLLGVTQYEKDISSIMEFSNCPLLEKSDISIRKQSYHDQLAEMGGEGTVDTYVPFRNGLFLSCAASLALSLGYDTLYYGAHADDAAGRAYPDCTPEFQEYISKAIYEGSGRVLSVLAPLLYLNKTEVVSVGKSLGAPLHMTWSCYYGGDTPCGECGTCIDRKNAFEANGLGV